MRSFLLSLLLLFSTFIFAQTPILNIKTDQFGYRPGDNKVAIISKGIMGQFSPDAYTPGSSFQVKRISGEIVYSGTSTAWNSGQTHTQSGDKVWWFDFSPVTDTGNFYVLDVSNNKRSFEFRIASDVYSNVMKHAVRMYFYQRCNIAKAVPYADARWADGASHRQDTACRSVTAQGNASTAKDLSGGWYDAGDFNKYVNFTHNPVHQLLSAYDENPTIFADNYNIPESGNGIPDIMDELKWELDWLLKMQLSNGSVLSKVGTLGYNAATPASADNYPRYYGAAAASATRVLCSEFAHASIVYRKLGTPAMITYADTLLARAIKAWTWIVANPATSNYDNSGFSSANPEQDAYTQNATRTTAAAYLYAATGTSTYKTYFESNYTNIQPYQWGYWYPYEAVFQDALLYYTQLPGITATVKNNILNNCKSSVNSGNSDLYPATTNKTDAYRAQLADDDYVWGSSQVKSNMGTIFSNMWVYGVDTAKNAQYKIAAEDYLHYMHGTNAMGLSMLSNMYGEGADNSVNEIYHAWFGDGTVYDNAKTSAKGPPHGYVTGGINKHFAPDGAYSGPAISPPQNQPVQKSYKDWNTGYPENSWQISEPAIYYQAAYIKLLSKFVELPAVVTCNDPDSSWISGLTTDSVKLNWTTAGPAYLVRISKTSPISWQYRAVSNTSLIVDTLQPNTSYLWQVRTICNPGDSSVWTDNINFTTPTLPCPIPDSTWTTSVTTHSAVVNWKNVGSQYQLRLSQATPAQWTYATTSSSNRLIDTLSDQTTYRWEVRTICGSGDTSAWSGTNYFTTDAIPAPFECPQPDSLWTSGITETTATLNWKICDSALTYTVEYRQNGNSSWTSINTPLNTHLLSGLQDSTTYEWRVTANCANDSSNWSDTITFTTFKTQNGFECQSPDSLTTSNISKTTADLWWNTTDSTSAYVVYYRLTGDINWFSATASGNTYSLTSLQPGSNYEWTIRSVCLPDTAIQTDTALFTTLNPDTCYSPTGLFTNGISPNSATVHWNPVNQVNGYSLKYRKASLPDYQFELTTDTFAVLTGLNPETEYRWEVKAYCTWGDSSVASSEESFTTLGYTGIVTTQTTQLNIFPNPTNKAFLVESNRNMEQLELFDWSGKLVYDIHPESRQYRFDQYLEKGIYLIKVKDNRGTLERKVVVN